MKTVFSITDGAKLENSKAEWIAPKLIELGDVASLTLGSGPGKADLGLGNFGHHGRHDDQGLGS